MPFNIVKYRIIFVHHVARVYKESARKCLPVLPGSQSGCVVRRRTLPASRFPGLEGKLSRGARAMGGGGGYRLRGWRPGGMEGGVAGGGPCAEEDCRSATDDPLVMIVPRECTNATRRVATASARFSPSWSRGWLSIPPTSRFRAR